MEDDGYLMPMPKKISDDVKKKIMILSQVKSSVVDLLNEVYGIIYSLERFNGEVIEILRESLESIFSRPQLLCSFLDRHGLNENIPEKVIEGIYDSVTELTKKTLLAITSHLGSLLSKIDK